MKCRTEKSCEQERLKGSAQLGVFKGEKGKVFDQNARSI